jgi:hypothetical protein
MKAFLTICLLLTPMAAIARAQPRDQNIPLTRAEAREAERLLADRGYWTGALDGIFDPASRAALVAFQKWQRRAVTGQPTHAELDAIRASSVPKAREVGYAHVEVDLDHQVLLLVNDAGGVKILPASTGNGESFLDEGQTSVAYTPRGRFLVYQKEVGWHSGSLGSTYYANFISGSVAIHGSRSVASQPASHGCIRIPMFAARQLGKLMPLGTIVLIYDKVSFVSAKDWVENPKLKQAALSSCALTDETDSAYRTKGKPESSSKGARSSRAIRAGLRLSNPAAPISMPWNPT